MKLFSFRNFRVLVLLMLLAAAAIYTHGQRLDSTDWIDPLVVMVFPINGDGDPATAVYIKGLTDADFAPIDRFTGRHGEKYDLLADPPTLTRIGPLVSSVPPEPPEIGANVLNSVFWSLRMRYWAWKHTPDDVSNRERVRIFVRYQQPDGGEPLVHSLGLQKGLLGLVHAYADESQNARNNLVITHELLHTVGATDKYGPGGVPLFPDGFAEPDRKPFFPQRRCEIMAGRVMLSEEVVEMASRLRQCLVGEATAREIGWIEGD
ncbi:MAG: hypothetical protein DIZ77_11860 [endosymbiont of Seepiophila jonesi]|uniref:Uncharacterized protein n=1 Tax=endosymbiont of Lamellibrachia luymesi TaxID=2200907 RepID=A0A370E0C4_9GAMM|nr:MAG: hypothetical protein DIZ77_11860 [endosymbiont of Seepiophila jonesi]RDH92656.1 MAG: hypothetical protein DIZ79_02785 [endosymbiont of Lamellibrachia luymesi]